MRGGRTPNLRGKPPSPFGPKLDSKVGLKKSPKNRPQIDPPFEHFWGPKKCSKIDPCLIFRGLGGGPKNGAPSRAPKSEILLLFITLELGPTSQKGTPFWSHFGDLFSQKNEKRGFQKSPKNHSQKTFKMGSHWEPHFRRKSSKNVENKCVHVGCMQLISPWPPNGSQQLPKSTQKGSQNGRFS